MSKRIYGDMDELKNSDKSPVHKTRDILFKTGRNP